MIAILTVLMHVLFNFLHVGLSLLFTLTGVMEIGVVYSCVDVLIAVGFNWFAVVAALFSAALLNVEIVLNVIGLTAMVNRMKGMI